ncbi:MAG: carbon-nitrogen hydrolase family protein [Eubacteriales bacterium]|nr:carbon-nitrogen hydrolase family protein [Eubacteriales bacterium]
MEDKFRLSICQTKVVDNKKSNIENAIKEITAAAGKGANIAVLPEMFNTPYDSKLFREYAEDINNGATVRAISEIASKLGIYVAAGSIPELFQDKVYNTCLMFDPKGRIIAAHRKMHLFDINIKDKIKFMESETLTSGDKMTVVDTGLCTMGISICYDLRFPELYRLMSAQGAKLIIVPAAFNRVTGPAHWELLIRARAVDNQVYIAAASQSYSNEAGYKAYGHSMAADPWGNVICRAGQGEETVSCEIDLAFLDKVRTELPVLKHLRNDIYEVIYKRNFVC